MSELNISRCAPSWGAIAHLTGRSTYSYKPIKAVEAKEAKKLGRKELFTEEEKEQIRQDRAEGMSRAEVAKKWGCSIDYLSRRVSVCPYQQAGGKK